MMYHVMHIRVTDRRKEISIELRPSIAHRALNIIFPVTCNLPYNSFGFPSELSVCIETTDS
jgi:hypothetical protein